MKLGIECLYCGHQWEITAYNKHSASHERCSVCKDTNLKVRDLTVTKVDYYKGCPPFPEKKNEDWVYTGMDFGFAPGVD